MIKKIIKDFFDKMSKPVSAWTVILWILSSQIGWALGDRL